ncbi:MAG: metalloregulator ArsR/SmtB family transcription factor [Actinomycetota bacterium]|nr:metalloregulator ArsR/SmtB family transcription factor [Actinomycetota bacterium]
MVLAPEFLCSDALKALADPTRLDICRRLASEELCVCHLVEDMGVSQPLLSHHLKVLREAGLVAQRRHSYWTYYRLHKEAFAALGDQMRLLGDRACGPGECRDCS